MFAFNSCYTLDYFRSNDGAEWEVVPAHVHGSLQVGNDYGMICIRSICPCGCEYNIDIFFGNVELDFMVRRMEPISIDKDMVVLRLPNGLMGRMSAEPSVSGFSDPYILRALAWSNDERDGADLDNLFLSLHDRIRKNASLRYLKDISLRMRLRRRYLATGARNAALFVLSRFRVPETALRMQIMVMAKLW